MPAVFPSVQTVVRLTAFRIFNMRTNVHILNAHWGCTDTVRESALKVDSRRKIPCWTRDSNLHQCHTCLFIQMIYQVSYPHSSNPLDCSQLEHLHAWLICTLQSSGYPGSSCTYFIKMFGTLFMLCWKFVLEG